MVRGVFKALKAPSSARAALEFLTPSHPHIAEVDTPL